MKNVQLVHDRFPGNVLQGPAPCIRLEECICVACASAAWTAHYHHKLDPREGIAVHQMYEEL